MVGFNVANRLSSNNTAETKGVQAVVAKAVGVGSSWSERETLRCVVAVGE